MTRHDLKILPKYFEDVVRYTKRVEVRRNDRGFAVGDRVRLREWDGDYTGREAEVEITYVLNAGEFPEGIQPGYCLFCFWVVWTETGAVE